MNPQLALRLAYQRQAVLRRERASRLPRARASNWSPVMAAHALARVRRGLGWVLIEIGLRLAVSSKGGRPSRVGASEAP
ncbi:MAG TPA: hypothetical protein VK217_01020 [Acidimicrobiales bacterium]|nr:hypothetical protein [Acidimicrobiales bacterium]